MDKQIIEEIAQLYSENYATLDIDAVVNECRQYSNVVTNKQKVLFGVVKELKKVYNII